MKSYVSPQGEPNQGSSSLQVLASNQMSVLSEDGKVFLLLASSFLHALHYEKVTRQNQWRR
jgi:hypothetical protein